MKNYLITLSAFCLLIGTSCQNNIEIDKNKDLIQAYTENFWNKHDIGAFDELVGADFVIHQADGDLNAEQYKELAQATFGSFPDLHVTTDDLIAEGDKVVKVWTVNSTHNGDYMGIPPTGKPILMKGIEVFRIKDGKIAEIWFTIDRLGMLQQLGVIPPMGG